MQTRNAHLIAAAPALYEALDALMLMMREVGMAGETEWERAVIAADEALAKARGEG